MCDRPKYNKEKLLKLYYQNPDKCDHIWINFAFGINPANYDILFSRFNVYSSSDNEALIIHFNSGGGLSETGFAIANLIKLFPKPVIGVNEFFCASAATFPYLLCDLRIMKPYSIFLIHQTKTQMIGAKKFKFTRRYNYGNQKEYQRRLTFYQKHTNMSLQDVKDQYRSESYMSVKDMKKFDIVHEIFDPKKKKKTKKNKTGKKHHITLSSFKNTATYLIQPGYLERMNINAIDIYFDSTFLRFEESILLSHIVMELLIPIRVIILNSQYLESILFALNCDKVYLSDSLINIESLPINFQSEDESLDDAMENKKYINNIIKTILTKKSKIPEKILKDMFKKYFLFESDEILKYKLVDGMLPCPESQNNKPSKLT